MNDPEDGGAGEIFLRKGLFEARLLLLEVRLRARPGWGLRSVTGHPGQYDTVMTRNRWAVAIV